MVVGSRPWWLLVLTPACVSLPEPEEAAVSVQRDHERAPRHGQRGLLGDPHGHGEHAASRPGRPPQEGQAAQGVHRSLSILLITMDVAHTQQWLIGDGRMDRDSICFDRWMEEYFIDPKGNSSFSNSEPIHSEEKNSSK